MDGGGVVASGFGVTWPDAPDPLLFLERLRPVRFLLEFPLGVVALPLVVLFGVGDVVVGAVGSVGVPVVGGVAFVSPAFGGCVGLVGFELSTGGGVVVVWLPAEPPGVEAPGAVDVPGGVAAPGAV